MKPWSFSGDLVNFLTEDGLELSGMLCGKGDTVFVQIHGLTGSLEGYDYYRIKEMCLEKGLAYFGFNNRGSGVIKSFNSYKSGKGECVTVGASLEIFEDCVKDIDAALLFLETKGFKKFILSGHSTGCQKVAYYQSQKKNKRVKALFLSGPLDDRQYQRKILGEKFSETVETAKKFVEEGKGNHFVPEDFRASFFTYNRYYNMYKENSSEGLLDPDRNFKELGKIDCPIFSILGNKDEYLTMDARTILEKIKRAYKNKKSKTFLIEGANHGFEGKENQLTGAISSCLDLL